LNRGHLSASQLYWMAVLSMVATLILMVPGELLRLAGRGAWWTPLVVAIAAVPLAFVVGNRAGVCGDAITLIQRRFGRLAAKALLIPVWLAFALDMTLILRETVEGTSMTFVAAQSLVPRPLVTALVLAPGVWLALLGSVVLARVSSVVTVAVLGAFVSGALVILPQLHVLWLLPLLPTDGRFWRGSALLLTALWMIEPTLLGMLVMHKVQSVARRRAGAILAAATASGAVVLSASIVLVISDFGTGRAAEFVVPLLHVAQDLPYSLDLEHLDTLVVPVEILAALGKIGIFLWLWLRVSEAIAPVRAPWLLALQVGVAAAAGFTLLPNIPALVHSMYVYAAYIVPTFLVLMMVAYLPSMTRARVTAK